jgi:hypothetical protein
MTIVELLYGTVLIQGSFQFECVNTLFPFQLATAKLIGNYFYNRQCVANRLISAITVPTYSIGALNFIS